MKLKNIKASFIFQNNVVESQMKQIIWQNGSIIFTIYKRSPKLINVTGIKSTTELEQQKRTIEEKFKQSVMKVRIDNAFFSKKNCMNIDMSSLYESMRDDKDYFVNYNVEIFPAMFFHPRNKIYPTILLFRTGSYTLMGGKSVDAIIESESFVKMLLQKYIKMPMCTNTILLK